MKRTKKKAMLAAFDCGTGKMRHKVLRVFEDAKGREHVRLSGSFQPIAYLCSMPGQICTVYF